MASPKSPPPPVIVNGNINNSSSSSSKIDSAPFVVVHQHNLNGKITLDPITNTLTLASSTAALAQQQAKSQAANATATLNGFMSKLIVGMAENTNSSSEGKNSLGTKTADERSTLLEQWPQQQNDDGKCPMANGPLFDAGKSGRGGERRQQTANEAEMGGTNHHMQQNHHQQQQPTHYIIPALFNDDTGEGDKCAAADVTSSVSNEFVSGDGSAASCLPQRFVVSSPLPSPSLLPLSTTALSSPNSDDANAMGSTTSRNPSCGPPTSCSIPETSPLITPSACSSATMPPSQMFVGHQSSHTLLFVPEQRRISNVSGHSVRSCPSEIYKEGSDGNGSAEDSPVVEAASIAVGGSAGDNEEADEETDEFHVLIHSPSNSNGQSRNASPRAQAACEAYSRVYGSGAFLFNNNSHEHCGGQQRLGVMGGGNSNKPLWSERICMSQPGSGNSPDQSRRRSVQTGAPAIAFRSTLGFAAAIAGANVGKMSSISSVQPTPSFRYPPRHRPFQRRSSQPIINVATGIATPGIAHLCRQAIRPPPFYPSPMNHLPGVKSSGTHRFSVGQVNSNTAGNEEGAPVVESNSGDVATAVGCMQMVPAMMNKRVSWLSMKSLQDCAAHHFHASDSCPTTTMFGTGGAGGGGTNNRPKKRDSAGVMTTTTTTGDTWSGGGGGKDVKASCDTRSNSQLGSLLQLNNSSCCTATAYNGAMDETTLAGAYDPLECPDTPPIDTMSWSNMDEFDNVTLMYSKHEKIPMKDFGSEIRATMDIDHLLNKAVLLLDLQETSLEEIFAKIIHEMDIQEPEFTSEQVRSVLFTQDAGNQFHILSRTVQSICTTGTVGGTFDYDQTWICALCMLNTVQHRHVAIARLTHPTNLGRTMQDLRFIIIVIAPSRAKGTKTALETTRTFATLFADMDIRQRLVMASTVESFRATLLDAAKELALEQSQWRERKASIHLSQAKEQVFGLGKFFPFRGMIEDFKRRKRHYISDYLDGLRGHRTIQKMFSSIIFLYFACLLPAIAFGVLNDDNTGGGINVRKGILAQAIGGIFFAAFGGQPMIILLTTVPLAIYIKVIYRISESLGYDFFAMYACVGLWCQFFLVLYAATELCSLMKLATRSAEEMFSLFIAIAFAVESVRAIHTSFMHNYRSCDDPRIMADAIAAEVTRRQKQMNISLIQKIVNPELQHNITGTFDSDIGCHRDTSILYLLLMFGTLWLALFLYNFRKTPYLTRSRREWLADYALPASVLIMSFLGAYTFSEIDKDMFKMRPEIPLFRIPEFWRLSWQAILVCFLLGFFLSFLFYMDQNICSAIVNNGQNKLKKGCAQHLDLFVVAILNMFLSIVGLPWMHGALPHSPLHLRALADVEERVAQGHVHEVIMNVRETRLATLIAHALILASTFFLLPFPLQWIPTSVLHGLFLYMAFTSLTGNEMVERLLLLITEQQAYPPTHYIRRVPQRKVHLFTTSQLIQLVILCAVGFSPYPFIEMVFPIVCFCFLPIRHVLIPRLIDYKYLDALDGRH